MTEHDKSILNALTFIKNNPLCHSSDINGGGVMAKHLISMGLIDGRSTRTGDELAYSLLTIEQKGLFKIDEINKSISDKTLINKSKKGLLKYIPDFIKAMIGFLFAVALYEYKDYQDSKSPKQNQTQSQSAPLHEHQSYVK